LLPFSVGSALGIALGIALVAALAAALEEVEVVEAVEEELVLVEESAELIIELVLEGLFSGV